MIPAQLRKAGETLARNDPETYGRGWQSALARALNVHPSAVRAWESGRSPVPEMLEMLIERLVEESRR